MKWCINGRYLLMLLPSFSLSPSAPLLLALSLPAKSTRLNLLTFSPTDWKLKKRNDKNHHYMYCHDSWSNIIGDFKGMLKWSLPRKFTVINIGLLQSRQPQASSNCFDLGQVQQFGFVAASRLHYLPWDTQYTADPVFAAVLVSSYHVVERIQ